MAPTEIEQLERMLAEERPAPDPDAIARIDERVRKAREPRRWQRLPSLPSARRLSYAGAAATLLVGLVIGVGQVAEDGEPAGTAPVDNALTSSGAPEAAAPPPEALETLSDQTREFDQGRKSGPRIEPGVASDAILPPVAGGGLAPGQDDRVVERSASITVSGDPEEVRAMADEVVAITDRLGGIVVSASVSDRPNRPESSSASLEIAVPVDRLDQALAEISEVGSVEAREQFDLDVTSEAVSVKNRLRNARETRNALRSRLAEATDPVEIEQLRRQIGRAERRVASRKADVKRLANRTQFARISVGITANGRGDDGSWSIGDAWDDAVEILQTMAGAALVTTAIALPLALLITLTYLALSRTRRRSRERALDD